jgi:hypothetical protein
VIRLSISPRFPAVAGWAFACNVRINGVAAPNGIREIEAGPVAVELVIEAATDRVLVRGSLSFDREVTRSTTLAIAFDRLLATWLPIGGAAPSAKA